MTNSPSSPEKQEPHKHRHQKHRYAKPFYGKKKEIHKPETFRQEPLVTEEDPSLEKKEAPSGEISITRIAELQRMSMETLIHYAHRIRHQYQSNDKIPNCF